MSETIFNLPPDVFWLWFSTLFYLVTILLFWPHWRTEKTDLMLSFLGFLAGMGWFHLFLGAGTYWNQPLLIYLSFLGALTGAAYTLKFPLTVFKESLRKPIFYLALLVAWLSVIWMPLFPPTPETMIWIVFLYMITISGSIAGFYIVWQGIKTTDLGMKIKGIGGGAGIITCCLAADVLVLAVLSYGLILPFSVEIPMALAPLILIVAIYLGRFFQEKTPEKAF